MNDQMKLTREDFALLFDGLEAAKKEKVSSMVLGDVIGAVFAHKDMDPAEKQRQDDERAAKMRKFDEDQRAFAERIVCVQAKLVYLRDRSEVESVIGGAV